MRKNLFISYRQRIIKNTELLNAKVVAINSRMIWQLANKKIYAFYLLTAKRKAIFLVAYRNVKAHNSNST